MTTRHLWICLVALTRETDFGQTMRSGCVSIYDSQSRSTAEKEDRRMKVLKKGNEILVITVFFHNHELPHSFISLFINF